MNEAQLQAAILECARLLGWRVYHTYNSQRSQPGFPDLTLVDATGLVPSLHAVVMCGGDLVWDPHPDREMGHLGFVSGEWFVARDPGALALKAAA